MEKRNVMKSGVLWNEVVTATHKAKYPDVELSHMLADAGGMQLVILGIMGEYIGRIFEEVKNRPLYLIARGKPKDEQGPEKD